LLYLELQLIFFFPFIIFCLETKETKIQGCINFWKQLTAHLLYFRKHFDSL